MGERNLDFDRIIDRSNTRSLKYDFAVKRGKPADVLPLWVADMDFQTSSYIMDALQDMVSHGIYGYSETKEEYFEIVAGWMKRRHSWEIKESWLIKTPGVVFAIAAVVKGLTQEGDGILIQRPVYYPFQEVIEDNNRIVVDNELVCDNNGNYHIDFEDFEKKIVEHRVKLYILCNPHNPVGRVWTKEELLRLGTICKKHGVIVFSDEIHADFDYEKKHTVFSKVREDFADFSIIATSPSKSFNLAGFQISNIFVSNPDIYHVIKKQIAAVGYSQVGLPGIVACEAAYQYGEEWLDAVLKYIKGNADFVEAFLKEKLPKVKMTKLEGTYLVWLDFRECGLDAKTLDEKIIYDAKLWLDSGSIFGRSGEGFQRINIACPRSVLKAALVRIAGVVLDKNHELEERKDNL